MTQHPSAGPYLVACSLLMAVAACDSTPARPAGPTMAEATIAPGGITGSLTCEDRASQLIDLTRAYTATLRDAKQACRGGTECVAPVKATMPAFNALYDAQFAFVNTCAPAPVEMCDGIDNNNNGAIDETFPDKGQVCVSGVGACTSYGVKVCSADGTGTICQITQPAQPGTEVSGDGIDNDCDGQTDEGCTPP